MGHMFRAIRRLAEERDDIKVVYPIHKNPLVREKAREVFGHSEVVKLIEPMDVYDFQNTMAKSSIRAESEQVTYQRYIPRESLNFAKHITIIIYTILNIASK